MITLTHPVQEVIRGRTSIRTYEKRPVTAELFDRIVQVISGIVKGPLGSKVRFQFIAATEDDPDILKGLGTYGVIQNPAGFVTGVVAPGADGTGLTDFGCAMEFIILSLADLGLGTCWLGGSFRKSRFAERINPQGEEIVPAVISVGYAASSPRMYERVVRFAARSDRRKSWDALFFRGDFDHVLSTTDAGKYAIALEMVRLAPSASNKQPWRIVFDPEKRRFHFFLQRSKTYQPDKLGASDLPRVDIGIAMCHFEMTMEEAGFPGGWMTADPAIHRLPPLTSYVATWEAA